MPASINKVILVGNLGRDPEVRLSQDGNKVVTLSVATSEHWKDRATDERKERVEWHRVVIFNHRLCEFAEQYMKKGNTVYVEGQLHSRKWTDQQNQESRIQEVVLRYNADLKILQGRSDNGGQRYEQNESGPGPSVMAAADLDDEIPF